MNAPAPRERTSTETRRSHDRREAIIRADAIGPDSFGAPKHHFGCKIIDISQGGVALLPTRKALAIGDKVYLRVEKLGGRTVYGVQVMNVRYREGYGHVAGCAWLPKSDWRPPLTDFKVHDE